MSEIRSYNMVTRRPARGSREYKSKRNVKTMDQMQSENIYKIDEKCLLEEIVVAVAELFDCRIVRSGEKALLHFQNGQKFMLSITEQ